MGIVILGVILFISGIFLMESERVNGQLIYQTGLALGISGIIVIGVTIGVSVKLWTRQWSGMVSPGSWTSAT